MPLKLVLLRVRACPECDKQHGTWEEVRGEVPGGVDLRDIDIEGNPDVRGFYAVRMHPTIVLERDGRELRRWTGVTGKEEILAAVRNHLEGEQRGKRAEVRAVPGAPAGSVPGRGSAPTPDTEHLPPGLPAPPPGEGPPPAP